jgi:hypothetical protein
MTIHRNQFPYTRRPAALGILALIFLAPQLPAAETIENPDLFPTNVLIKVMRGYPHAEDIYGSLKDLGASRITLSDGSTGQLWGIHFPKSIKVETGQQILRVCIHYGAPISSVGISPAGPTAWIGLDLKPVTPLTNPQILSLLEDNLSTADFIQRVNALSESQYHTLENYRRRNGIE